MNDLDFAIDDLKESNKKLRRIKDKLKDLYITKKVEKE